MHSEKSIESWRIKFSLASSIDSMDVTSEVMKKSEAHLERAAAEYKTPSKAPGGFDHNDPEILPEMEEFAYSKQITDPEAFAEDLQYPTGLLELTRVVGELETQSIDAALELRTMHEAIELELLDNRTTASLFFDQAKSEMGAAPEESSSRWSSPTLWGTVSEMAGFLETLAEGEGKSKLTADQEAKIRQLVIDLVTVQTQSMLEVVRTGLVEQRPFLLYAKGVRTSIGVQSVETSALKNRMNGVEESLNLFQGGNGTQHDTTSHENLANAWLNGGFEAVPNAT
jgi:hypothetical protein